MKDVEIVCCIFLQHIHGHNRLLMVQRRPDQTYPMMWSIPGGKVELHETLCDAASRESLEELGVVASFRREPLTRRKFVDGEKRFNLHYMIAIDWEGDMQNRDGHDMRWIGSSDLTEICQTTLADDLFVAHMILRE